MSNIVKNEKKKGKCVVLPDGSIKPFNQIELSTKVVIILTNIQVNKERFFQLVPITEYAPPVKRRGRKSKDAQEVRPEILPFGSCIFVQKKEQTRGTPLTKKKRKWFLHCVTAVYALNDGKFANIKIPSNGNLQITGCKTEEQYKQSLEVVLKSLQDIERMTGERVFTVSDQFTNANYVEPEQVSPRIPVIKSVFNTVMENRDFNLGFAVSRENLDNFIHEYYNKWSSCFESAMNTSVQIKIQNDRYKDVNISYVEYDINDNKCQLVSQKQVPYTDYMNLFEGKTKKKDKEQKYFTFAVFAVGSVIMSARGPGMESVYNEFVRLVTTNRQHIEQVIIEENPIVTVSTVSVNGQDVDPDETRGKKRKRVSKKVLYRVEEEEETDDDEDDFLLHLVPQNVM